MRVRAGAAAVLAVVLAGCGGGRAGSGDASWGQRADAICDRAERDVRAIEPPQDIADLDRALVQVSETVRAAIGELRELDASAEEKAHAKPFLADLGLVERRLDQLAGATGGGERRAIEKAGRSLRLDVVDIAAHAEEAGLTRCGREKTGVAAVDAVLTTTYAQFIGRSHVQFVFAERKLERRWDPDGARGERGRYWLGLRTLLDRWLRDAEVPEGMQSEVRTAYWDALDDIRVAADYLGSRAKGEMPITHDRVSESQGRRRVKAFLAAGFTLLGQLGPAGEAQLRILQGGGPSGSGGPEGQES